MFVNVVTEEGSWILKRIAEESIKYCPESKISNHIDTKYQINYFVNYALYKPSKTKSVAYFTHFTEACGDKWREAEKGLDGAVYMAKRYTPRCKNSIQIPPPGLTYMPEKFRIGVVGRQYADGRKGEKDILSIAKKLISYPITWDFMGSWPISQDIRNLSQNYDVVNSSWKSDYESIKYYKKLNVIISMATLEGGPVPLLEAAKIGTPIISTNIGNTEYWGEFADIVGNVEQATSLLRSKLNIHERRRKLASLSWERFSRQHFIFFKSLLK